MENGVHIKVSEKENANPAHARQGRDLHLLVKSQHQRPQESNTFDALVMRTVVSLLTDEPPRTRTNGGNISNKFQRNNLYVVPFHKRCRHLKQIHLSTAPKSRNNSNNLNQGKPQNLKISQLNPGNAVEFVASVEAVRIRLLF